MLFAVRYQSLVGEILHGGENEFNSGASPISVCYVNKLMLSNSTKGLHVSVCFGDVSTCDFISSLFSMDLMLWGFFFPQGLWYWIIRHFFLAKHRLKFRKWVGELFGEIDVCR